MREIIFLGDTDASSRDELKALRGKFGDNLVGGALGERFVDWFCFPKFRCPELLSSVPKIQRGKSSEYPASIPDAT
jgi:hypothetical protein